MKNVIRRIAALLLGCLVFHGSAIAAPPQAPVTVDISDGVQIVPGNKAIRATLEIKAATPVRARLRVFTTPINGNPVEGGMLIERVTAVKEAQKLAIEIPVKSAGDFELSAIVEKEEGSVSDGALGYVRLTEEGEVSLMLPQKYHEIRGRERALTEPGFGLQPRRARPGLAPPPLQREAEQDKAGSRPMVEDAKEVHLPGYNIGSGRLTPGARPQAIPGAAKKLLITGNVSTTVNGVVVPMANTSLEIWDSDSFSPDDLLGTTETDASGNYSITVDNDDGPFGGGVDVYLYETSRRPGKIAVLQLIPDGQGGYFPFYYAWRSPTRDDITAPSVAINFSITDNARAAAVWMGASRAWWLSENQSGHKLSYVEVRFPGFTSGTYYRGGIINIDSQYGDSPETVGHEYGHAVMDQAYGGVPGEGGVHFMCAAASAGLAWSEGFATALGLVVGNGNGIDHWNVGDTGLSIENWSCNLRDMSTDEGRVAAGLWDLYDTANDNNGGSADRGVAGHSDANQGAQLVTLAQILQTLWVSKQNDTTAYWSALRPRLNANQTATSDDIMTYNYYK